MEVSYGVEDNVHAPGQYASIVGLSSHCVGLARVGDSIGEEEAISSLEQIFDERHGHLVKHFPLACGFIEDVLERVLSLKETMYKSIPLARFRYAPRTYVRITPLKEVEYRHPDLRLGNTSKVYSYHWKVYFLWGLSVYGFRKRWHCSETSR